MELDLIEQLEWSATTPMASYSWPAMEENGEDEKLELSLWWSSGDVGSRKRLREGDEAVEGKKPKREAVLVPCGLHVMPGILHGPNGNCYSCMVPYWIPYSIDVVQDSVDESEIKQNFEIGGIVAGNSQLEAAGGHGLSLVSSNFGTTFSQSSSTKGESISSNESRNHSSSTTIDNCATFSAFRDAKSRLKKPPTQIRGRKKPALSRIKSHTRRLSFQPPSP